METYRSQILSLFTRPTEPVYIPKGPSNIVFNICANELPTRYQIFADRLLSRFSDGMEKTVMTKKQMEYPDMSFALELNRDVGFSYFLPKHRKIAGQLVSVLMNMKSLDDLMSIAVAFRDRINPELFVYALSIALLHRKDTKNLPLPPLFEIFPKKFFPKAAVANAGMEAQLMEEGSRTPIRISTMTGNAVHEFENQLAYWREDLGINLHHWHWHLVYPNFGEKSVIDKDRRGELFYYMHQQVMARYNCERLCNGMPPVRPLLNLKEPIKEGYYPNLDSKLASKIWPGRANGATLQDVVRPEDGVNITLSSMERYRERILLAINSGQAMQSDNSFVSLDAFNGIDILGNIIETSDLSPNRNFYGDYHNSGHSLISFIHDPKDDYNTSFGVMGDTATAMRDPIFYRWHAAINDIFHEHKLRLPKYTEEKLLYPGIKITNCRVLTPTYPPNLLLTHWNESTVDLSKGLDFQPRGDVLVQVTHLNYVKFHYQVAVTNYGRTPVIGTVRIFIGPKNDKRGVPLNFRTQRELMIEMDKFYIQLQPGTNTIHRDSTDSGVTIPFEQTFRNLDEKPTGSGSVAFDVCGCGWPQHMLIPRGNQAGYKMVLFVMISNDQPMAMEPVEFVPGCQPAASYCGLRDRQYPDPQPMGYPFDRSARHGVDTLSQFLTPNMGIADISIRFENVVKPRIRRSTDQD